MDSDRIYTTMGLAALFDNSGEQFTAHLMFLIGIADDGNRARLAQGFPELVAAYDTWIKFEHAPTVAELRAAITARG